jgi:hypothetical protein
MCFDSLGARMRTTIKLLIGFAFLSVQLITPSHAQTAAEVVFYHHRSLASGPAIQQNNFPLYPVGDEVPNLPRAIAKEETDLKLIQQYYNDVAKAFFTAAEQLEERAGSDLEKVKKGQAQISWAAVRKADSGPLTRGIGEASKNKIDTTTEKAQRLAVTNKGFTYSKSLEGANELRRKGEFYSELADTAQQLKEGIMQ